MHSVVPGSAGCMSIGKYGPLWSYGNSTSRHVRRRWRVETLAPTATPLKRSQATGQPEAPRRPPPKRFGLAAPAVAGPLGAMVPLGNREDGFLDARGEMARAAHRTPAEIAAKAGGSTECVCSKPRLGSAGRQTHWAECSTDVRVSRLTSRRGWKLRASPARPSGCTSKPPTTGHRPGPRASRWTLPHTLHQSQLGDAPRADWRPPSRVAVPVSAVESWFWAAGDVTAGSTVGARCRGRESVGG